MSPLGADGLIPFIVMIVFAIVGTLLERRARKEKQRERNPAPGEPRRKSWEEELQDLLQNRPAPPPIRRDVPAPPSTYVPPPVNVPAPPPPLPEEEGSREVDYPSQPTFEPSHGSSHADEPYAHAASLQQRVEQHMASATRRVATTTRVERHDISARTREAVQLVRNPANLRTAILAQVILGPPKALEG